MSSKQHTEMLSCKSSIDRGAVRGGGWREREIGKGERGEREAEKGEGEGRKGSGRKEEEKGKRHPTQNNTY